jgi:hypothetical protein
MKEKPAAFLALLLAAAVLIFVPGCKQAVDSVVQNVDKNQDDSGGAGWDDIGDGGGGEEDDGSRYTVQEGNGTLKSKGRAAEGSTTYYVDAENGNDNNSGRSPIAPWKSFKKVNARTFKPGDHILLEADSIWNGEPVTLENRATLLTSDKVGMLWPKGDGEDGKPIVIDLYDIDNFSAAKPVVSWSANQRPIINGNGTPSTDNSSPYRFSGAVNLENQSYWEIYNIECTNTFADFATESNHWYDHDVRKGLAGIIAYGTNTSTVDYKHIVIRNCYVHDVQSEHNNNSRTTYTSTYFGGSHSPAKVVGGILVNANGVDGTWIENNIVKRVGLEGLRNSASNNKNVYIRGNYIEQVAGDGIVLSGTLATGESIVEHNIVKDSCAAPNLGNANYAALWAYIVKGATIQYNEAYGTVYGYQDGEAWDIDSGSDKVVYQYNYSHHNAGGAILFMSDITDGVFRYNISANDGGSTKYMATVGTVDTSAQSYTTWNSQTIFHYTATTTTAGRSIPLIYNNTFYIGDGVTCGLYGHNASSAVNKYVRFYNNILLKAGSGTVYLSYGHAGNGYAGSIYNTAGFKNNLIWGYGTDPNTGDYSKFSNGSGKAVAELFAENGNTWQNPGLKIQDSAALITALRTQRDDAFPESDYNNPEALAAFTGTERLRGRAALFSPVAASTVTGGMEIPSGGGSEVDGAWDGSRLTEDFFGAAITPASPPIGAAAGPYSQP